MIAWLYEPLPGGDRFLERLSAIAARAEDFAPAFELVVESFRKIEQERFDANGPGWEPLAPSTVANRERKGSDPSKILQDTGVLMASLENAIGGLTPISVEVGTRVPYAHWHQAGGTTPGRPPQRKILDLGVRTGVEWAGIVQGWLFGPEA